MYGASRGFLEAMDRRSSRLAGNMAQRLMERRQSWRIAAEIVVLLLVSLLGFDTELGGGRDGTAQFRHIAFSLGIRNVAGVMETALFAILIGSVGKLYSRSSASSCRGACRGVCASAHPRVAARSEE